jgi:SLT domain-containing protein
LANVAAIRSQSYSGRRFGGSVMEGESYLVGEAGPEIFTPASSGTVTKNSDIGSDKVVNVNFTINAMDTTSFDEMLLNRRGVIQQVIRDAVLETGQRSRF